MITIQEAVEKPEIWKKIEFLFTDELCAGCDHKWKSITGDDVSPDKSVCEILGCQMMQEDDKLYMSENSERG